MTRNTLKYIALLAMAADHIAYVLITPDPHLILYDILRLIGRLTAPIMCYFLAEGFVHTGSVKAYGIRLGVFALIAQPFYTLAFSGWSMQSLLTDWNMIAVLFLAFLCLVVIKEVREMQLRALLLAGLVLISWFCDWGVIAPLWVCGFYMLREQPRQKFWFFTLIAVVEVIATMGVAGYMGYGYLSQFWQAGVFLAIPLLMTYQGEKGSSHAFHKWVFYVFYPAHLGVIALVDRMIG